MVRKSAKEETGVVTRGKRGVVGWEAQMLADAEIAAAQEASTGGGQFIGLKAGVITINGTPVPNNEFRCVILDNIFENVYYEDDYDQDNPGAPRCFAYGRYDAGSKKVIGIDNMDSATDEGMAPHKSVVNPVHHDCETCPMNQFGTSKTGRGKACGNRRRLGVVLALGITKKGQFTIDTTDVDHYMTAPITYLKTPVTSSKIFGGYTQQVATSLKRPPYGVFTRIFTIQGGDNQFSVNFECVDSIPASLSKTIMQRHEEAVAAIAFPYAQLSDDSPKKDKKPGKSRVGFKPTTAAQKAKGVQKSKRY
jgi:hypothetical protein